MNTKTLIAVALLVSVLTVAVLWVAARERAPLASSAPVSPVAPVAAPAPVAPTIGWNSDFNVASTAAQTAKKPMMVDFYTDWCGWCKRLDQDTYTDVEVRKLAQSFVCVKVNGEQRRDLVEQYGVSGYPTIVFLNSKLMEVKRVGGYQPPTRFVSSMQEALNASGSQ